MIERIGSEREQKSREYHASDEQREDGELMDVEFIE